MERFNECKRSVMTTHQCIDCALADKCDDPYSEKEGRKIRIGIMRDAGLMDRGPHGN